MMEQQVLGDILLMQLQKKTCLSFTHHLEVVLIIQFTTAALPVSACRRCLWLGDLSSCYSLKLMGFFFYVIISVFSFILKSRVYALSLPSCGWLSGESFLVSVWKPAAADPLITFTRLERFSSAAAQRSADWTLFGPKPRVVSHLEAKCLLEFILFV